MRSSLTERSASRIATKLGAEIKPGRKHTKAIVRIDEVYVGSFGIRQGGNTGHDYIPRQIQTSMRQAIGLDRCNVAREDYEDTLRRKGILPKPTTPETQS